jgi:hypothetical protein
MKNRVGGGEFFDTVAWDVLFDLNFVVIIFCGFSDVTFLFLKNEKRMFPSIHPSFTFLTFNVY